MLSMDHTWNHTPTCHSCSPFVIGVFMQSFCYRAFFIVSHKFMMSRNLVNIVYYAASLSIVFSMEPRNHNPCFWYDPLKGIHNPRSARDQCVEQTSRGSCQPLIEGVIGRGTAQRPLEALRPILNFFLGYLVAISFPIEFDVWGRLCTHVEAAKVMTFVPVPQHFSLTHWVSVNFPVKH